MIEQRYINKTKTSGHETINHKVYFRVLFVLQESDN